MSEILNQQKNQVHTLFKRSGKSCAGSFGFGFNTPKKVAQISGDGNHNTALFWEYDTRLGRRWNTDPVVKEWALGGFNINGNATFVLGTYQHEKTAPNLLNFDSNWNSINQIMDIHNHPFGRLYGASGYGKFEAGGDLGSLKLGNPKAPHHVYDISTQSVFQYTRTSSHKNKGKVSNFRNLMNLK